MTKASEKQLEIWNYFRECFDKNGKIPSFKETAENFGISTAAVSHRIDAMRNNKLIVKLPLIGYVLLDENGHVYYTNRKNFLYNSHAEIRVAPLPSNMVRNDTTLVMNLIYDFPNYFFLKYGDFLEVEKPPVDGFKSGDLLLIKKDDIFLVKMYLSIPRSRNRNYSAPPYTYNKKTDGTNIIGIITGMYRSTTYEKL